MDACKEDQRRLGLLSRSGELEAVADEVRDFLDLFFLIVMGEDNGALRLF
jgi:hypothetical protein